jgi:hypothetical protein
VSSDPQGIPKSLLESNDDFEDEICALCSYSLIETNADATEFEMHQLVQFSTKSWLELRDETEKWKKKLIATMDGEIPLGQYENWTKCQKFFSTCRKSARVSALQTMATSRGGLRSFLMLVIGK